MKLKSEIDVIAISYIPDQPGFVKCQFSDAFGAERTIVEKVPVITLDNIDGETILPKRLKLSGTVRKTEYETNEIVNFTPDHNIEDVDGNVAFMINKCDLKTI